MRVVIALGGNAMTAADGSIRPDDQRAAIERAAAPIADLAVAGHEVVVTHGNGPQVGNLLVKNEMAAAVVPPVPLDWCGAQTQATIGFLLLNALDRSLARRGSRVRTAALVFAQRTGRPAVITSLGRLALALEEASGTVVTADNWATRRRG